MSANKEPEKTKARPSLAKMLGGSALQSLLVPILAIFTGLVIGGIVIAVTDKDVAAAFGNFSADPGGAFKADLDRSRDRLWRTVLRLAWKPA